MWVADMDFRPPPEVDRRASRPRPRTASSATSATTALQGGDLRLDGPPPRLGGRPRRDLHHPRHRRRPRHLPAGLHRARRRRDPLHPGLPRLLPHHPRQRPRDRPVAARPARRRPLRHGPRGARRLAHRPRAHGRPLLAAQPRRPGLERATSSARSPTSAAPTTSSSPPTRSTTTSSSPAAGTSPMPLAAPEVLDRLVMLTAATKTFNIAGTLTGNVIIPDDGLRRRFAAAHLATGTSPNRFGALMATAAYARGDAWVDALCRYLAGNAAAFGAGHRRHPRPAPDAARLDLPRLGRLLRHRHGAGRVHRPRREGRPHRRQPRPRPSARAARASCASTSAPPAPGWRRPSAASQAAFADLQ